MRLLIVSALLALAAVPTATACNDAGFIAVVITSDKSTSASLEHSDARHYATAKVDALAAWRALAKSPVPCNKNLSEARTQAIKAAASLYRQMNAMTAHNPFQAIYWQNEWFRQMNLATASAAMYKRHPLPRVSY